MNTVKQSSWFKDLAASFFGLLVYSTRSFTEDHRKAGIRAVRLVTASEGEVILDIPDHSYNCRVDEGVYLGILGMFGIEKVWLSR